MQASGAWEWIGLVKKPYEAVLGGLALVLVGGVYWRYHRLRRPEPDVDRWRRVLAGFLMAVPVLGYLVGLFLVDRDRLRYTFQNAIFWFGFAWLVMFAAWAGGPADGLGLFVVLIMLAALLWGWLGGRFLVGAAASPDAGIAGTAPILVAPPPAATSGAAVARGGGAVPVGATPAAASTFRVRRSGELSTFADVGGMEALKAELKDTFGLMLAFAGEADDYRLEWNGLLLHGPPGVGKTFIAQAVAGEFGLNFIHVTTADIVSSYGRRGGPQRASGRSPSRLRTSRASCSSTSSTPSPSAATTGPTRRRRRTVNELLTGGRGVAPATELIVMAATNDLDKPGPGRDPPGRFDRHIRVDLPDAEGPRPPSCRRSWPAARPAGLDLAVLVRRTEGLTPAALAAVVSAASLAALQESVAGGGQVLSTRPTCGARSPPAAAPTGPAGRAVDWDSSSCARA